MEIRLSVNEKSVHKLIRRVLLQETKKFFYQPKGTEVINHAIVDRMNTISERRFEKLVGKAVNNYLEKQGLLGFIRKTIQSNLHNIKGKRE